MEMVHCAKSDMASELSYSPILQDMLLQYS